MRNAGLVRIDVPAIAGFDPDDPDEALEVPIRSRQKENFPNATLLRFKVCFRRVGQRNLAIDRNLELSVCDIFCERSHAHCVRMGAKRLHLDGRVKFGIWGEALPPRHRSRPA